MEKSKATSAMSSLPVVTITDAMEDNDIDNMPLLISNYHASLSLPGSPRESTARSISIPDWLLGEDGYIIGKSREM